VKVHENNFMRVPCLPVYLPKAGRPTVKRIYAITFRSNTVIIGLLGLQSLRCFNLFSQNIPIYPISFVQFTCFSIVKYFRSIYPFHKATFWKTGCLFIEKTIYLTGKNNFEYINLMDPFRSRNPWVLGDSD